MEIKHIPKYKLIVVKISGEIDDHISKTLRNEIDSKILYSGAVNVAFDFSEVEFMDSSGIGVIIGRYKKVSALGGGLIIFGMNANVRRLLEMANLKSIATITDNLEDGIKEVC